MVLATALILTSVVAEKLKAGIATPRAYVSEKFDAGVGHTESQIDGDDVVSLPGESAGSVGAPMIKK